MSRAVNKRPFSKPATQQVQSLENRRLMSTVLPVATPAVFVSPAASWPAVAGLSPAQIRHAYGFDTVTFGGGKVAADGSGQTIAIVDAYNDPVIAADLKTFDAKFGLTNPTLTVVNQTGGTALPAGNTGWGQEISLDVEWAHAIAPAAKILLVEARTASTTDLLAAVKYARGVAGVSAVSMSFGTAEFSTETSFDSYFTTPSGHTGVTFLASSGDGGSARGTEWPASSANVVSVGGTSLDVTGTVGVYSGETGWSGSGGGASRFVAEPSYQSKAQTTGTRTVPDVSYDANPSTGVAVYDSYGNSGWMVFGGTSAAAPQWAGLVAIADQGRSIGKLASLDGRTNTLPALYGLFASSSTTYFHDITSGSSSRSISAAVGYDHVTGLGTPRAGALINALVKSTTYTAAKSVSASAAAAIANLAAAAEEARVAIPQSVTFSQIQVTFADSSTNSDLEVDVGSAVFVSTVSTASPSVFTPATTFGADIIVIPSIVVRPTTFGQAELTSITVDETPVFDMSVVSSQSTPLGGAFVPAAPLTASASDAGSITGFSMHFLGLSQQQAGGLLSTIASSTESFVARLADSSAWKSGAFVTALAVIAARAGNQRRSQKNAFGNSRVLINSFNPAMT